jgi:hypothetical protein
MDNPMRYVLLAIGWLSVALGVADILVRMNLSSLPLMDEQGLSFEQLPQLRTLQVGQTGEWPAVMQQTADVLSSDDLPYPTQISA